MGLQVIKTQLPGNRFLSSPCPLCKRERLYPSGWGAGEEAEGSPVRKAHCQTGSNFLGEGWAGGITAPNCMRFGSRMNMEVCRAFQTGRFLPIVNVPDRSCSPHCLLQWTHTHPFLVLIFFLVVNCEKQRRKYLLIKPLLETSAG